VKSKAIIFANALQNFWTS